MKKGFTLIELLAVIVILAIIATIATILVLGMIKSASKGAMQSDTRIILRTIDREKVLNRDFDPTQYNNNLQGLLDELGIRGDNYESISFSVNDGELFITIEGKGKYTGLVACGNYNNISVSEGECDFETDIIAPTISLNGDENIELEQGLSYTELGATATDDVDASVTVTTSGTVDNNTLGIYTVTYRAEDVAGNVTTKTRKVTIIRPYYNASKGVNRPVLATGMTPIKWNGSTWVDTTEDDTAWYNYDTTNKVWANAKTEDGSMWVWIPRYAYQIATYYHVNTTGTINIKFLKKGTTTAADNSTVVATATYSGSTQTNYILHPAFTFGSTELTGIWVAKFEATASEGVVNPYSSNGSCPTAGDNDVTKTVKIIPNATSWRCITVGNMFTAVRNMEIKNTYGWSLSSTLKSDGTFTTDTNNIDTHLMKNIEWGAIAYLSKSAYGKNAEEIYINNNQNYSTGCSGNSATESSYNGCRNAYETTGGVKASTTGTVYGIYDMSGGTWERVAAYVDNGSGNLNGQGSSIMNALSKYKDVYAKHTTESSANNYSLTTNIKGDAIWETSSNGIGTGLGWYTDYTIMPSTYPWLLRGGQFSDTSNAGVFNFADSWGGVYSVNGFRPVLVVGAGL